MIKYITAVLLGLFLASPVHAQSAAAPVAALSNTPVSVKVSRGAVISLLCYNPNAAMEFVKFYDTLATVTPGTTVATFFVPLPASTTTLVQLGVNMYTAIQVAATTTVGGGTAPGSALQCSVLFQ
jgi:hypothetical protein